MKSIVLLRHGESVWNKENRFTGWTDVDLTEKGVAEAYRTGNLLKEKGYVFNKAYTSIVSKIIFRSKNIVRPISQLVEKQMNYS